MIYLDLKYTLKTRQSKLNRVEPGYNDIGVCDASPIASDV